MKFLPNGEDRNANYGTLRIKSPKEMIDYVHKQNAHIMISVWASFGPWTEMYQKMDSLKALLHFETWPPKAGVKPYDPFNPTARDMYWAEMKRTSSISVWMVGGSTLPSRIIWKSRTKISTPPLI